MIVEYGDAEIGRVGAHATHHPWPRLLEKHSRNPSFQRCDVFTGTEFTKDPTEGLAGGDILNAVLYAAAMAVEREGPACTITRDDFLRAVEAGRRAKRAVGAAA